MRNSKQSHSAEKPKGGPFTLMRFCRLRLKSKKRGDPLQTIFFSKTRTVPKKFQRGTYNPVVLSGFVSYVKN